MAADTINPTPAAPDIEHSPENLGKVRLTYNLVVSDARRRTGSEAEDGSSAGRLSLGRRLLFSLIPVALLVAVGAVGFEAALRLRYTKIEEITGATEWHEAEFGGFIHGWDRYHPLLGWTNQPRYRSDDSLPYVVTINSQGLRATRDYASRAPRGVTRIALFGDSLAFGEEVNDNETVAAHLESLVSGLEVLNYGVHGYSFGQAVLRLEEEGGLLAPDRFVVMVLFPEDLVRDGAAEFSHPKPVFRVVDGSLVVDNVPVPEASRMPRLLQTSFAAAWLFGRRGSWYRTPPDPDAYLACGRAIAERAAVACSALDRPLTIVVLLAPAGVVRYLADPEWRDEFDTERAKFLELPLDMLDLIPVQLAAYRAERAALFAPLAHWSSRGNRIWAEEIARHIGVQ